MHGRSQYGFPTIKTLKKHQQRSAKKDLEAHIDTKFKYNRMKQGLVMVDVEKQTRAEAPAKHNPELDSHAQFLTGDGSK